MKKVFTLISKLSFIMTLVLIIACSKENNNIGKQSEVDLKVKGGIPDKIIFTGIENKEIALKKCERRKIRFILESYFSK